MLDYRRIEKAILYLTKDPGQRPSLEALARHVGLSPFHFQRLFSRWAGISPKRFAQVLTVEHAKAVLRQTRSLLDASFEVGLSGPGRLHDLFVQLEAVTPGEFKELGAGLVIRRGLHETPLGGVAAAATDRGLCSLVFPPAARSPWRDLEERWPRATFTDDPGFTRPYVDRIFPSARRRAAARPLRVLVRGTNLQVQVWRALLRLPEGGLVTYRDLATLAGNPKAVRAVGTAVGRNPIAVLIPCHRVILSTGATGQYRWGAWRKCALQAWEQASEPATEPPPNQDRSRDDARAR